MTLTELLNFPGPDGVKTVLLSFLQRIEFPITDWESGGVVRTFVELESAVTSDLLDAIAIQVAGGYLDSSEDDWLTDLAHGWYAIDRTAAKVAQQTVTLACAAGFGPYTISAATVLTATDGGRYLAATGGTLPSGGTLAIDAIAESPGAARGLVNASSLPGVTVTLAAIKIIATVPQFGADEERDASVAKRCNARWPDLGVDPEAQDRVTKWALASDPAITRTRVDNDNVNPGGVNVTVAGSGGAVLAAAVTAAQTYINARAPITDYITAQNASNLTVTAGGTVIVPAVLAAQIKAAADAAWNAYLAVAKIGSAVFLSELVQAVMDAGAIDFTGATLNGSPANLALSPNQVAAPHGSGLATLLSWSAV